MEADAAPGAAEATVKLWSAGDVGVISFLFGFPAGLGLAARNWYRLGRRPEAFAHLVAGVVGLVLIMVVPNTPAGFALLINIAVALYLYYRTRTTIKDTSRAGIRVQRGGAAAGFATILGAWVAILGVSVLLATAVLLAIPGAGAGEGDVPATTPSAAPAPSLAIASPSPTGTPAMTATASAQPSAAPTPDLSDCQSGVGLSHQAPDLEAMLPKRVGGRDLVTWSVSGWCWLAMGPDDESLAELAELLNEESIDVAHFQHAVAGRQDTRSDPPYFVLAGARPLDGDEADLALYFLLGAAGFTEPSVDLADYEYHEVEGRTYFVGTPDMVTQNEHQRGRPYLYQTNTAMFVIITDDDGWAEDAIRQLPCCWSD